MICNRYGTIVDQMIGNEIGPKPVFISLHQVTFASLHLAAVFGEEKCTWMVKTLDHFGPEKFAVGAKFFPRGGGGGLFLFLLNQVYFQSFD